MPETKYGDCLIHTPGRFPLELQGKGGSTGKDPVPGVKAIHLMSVDKSVREGFFTVDCSWMWSGAAKGPVGESHAHDFSHVIGFIGGHPDDPQDLGGEISVWLDGNRETLTRNCLIFVPAGVPHGPFLFSRIDRPVFFITIAMVDKYTWKNVPAPSAPQEKKYSVIDHTKERFTVAAGAKSEGPPPPPPPPRTTKGARILHIEDDMVPGSFYVDFVWIFEGTGGAPAPEHTHDWPELIAMAGADPRYPRQLGGKMSIVLGNETHYTDLSTLVCIPKYTKHCPWLFHDIRRPTLVFSAGPQGMYTGSHKKD
jgi:quercetin dioxygenase-like cupin family protein